MADKHDQWADTLSTAHSGWLTGFLAEEDKIDRRTLWRLGSWGVAAVGAVVIAILASQSEVQLHRDKLAASDMINRQAQQLQSVSKETQIEARRLSLAIETLNSDRDRLFARVTSMEQGLETVTGSIKRQPPIVAAAPAPAPAIAMAPLLPAPDPMPQAQATADLPSIPAAPLIGPVAAVAAKEQVKEPAKGSAKDVSKDAPKEVSKEVAKDAAAEKRGAIASNFASVAPLVASKSIMAPPDAAATKLSEPTGIVPAPPVVESAPVQHVTPDAPAPVQTAMAEPTPAEVVATPVNRTEFGVDIGGANSVDGLRAIWRGMAKSRALTGLRPIIMVKERATGLGMQLRLVAGPLNDAAAAAKICASLTESNRTCETSNFDGQRLALKAETAAPEPAAATAPAHAKPAPRRRAAPKPQERTEQQPPPKPAEEAAPPKPQSSLTSFLGMRRE